MCMHAQTTLFSLDVTSTNTTPFLNHADSDPTTVSPNMTTGSPNENQCPTCSMSTILTAVISILTTALLATVIFVLVQIALCRYHPKFIRVGTESAASGGGEGQAIYEQVDDVVDRGVAVRTNMEFEGGGVEAMELEKNKAYEEAMKLEKNEAYGQFT